jgi:hypothetical protein
MQRNEAFDQTNYYTDRMRLMKREWMAEDCEQTAVDAVDAVYRAMTGAEE